MTTLPRRKERNDTFRTAASLIKRWLRDGVTLSHWRLRPLPFVLPDQRNFKINDFVIFKFILNKKNCYEELNFKRMSAISDLEMTMIQIEKELDFVDQDRTVFIFGRITCRSSAGRSV